MKVYYKLNIFIHRLDSTIRSFVAYSAVLFSVSNKYKHRNVFVAGNRNDYFFFKRHIKIEFR